MYDSNRMVLLAGSGENCQSTPFDYNKTDFIVLEFENEVRIYPVFSHGAMTMLFFLILLRL